MPAGQVSGPLPADFRLRFAPDLRRPRPGVLVGGAPLRVLRLSPAGTRLVAAWMAGAPVGPGAGAGRLAARLVDAGLADPVPPPVGAPTAVPQVVVVIPVHDDPAGLAATLGALASTAPGPPVVVVDDGSRRPLPADAAPGTAPPVSLLRHAANRGPAAARNTGWRYAPVDPDGIVAFVDAGCIPEPGWLETLTAQFADPGLVAAAPRVASRAAPGAPGALVAYERAHSPLDMGPAPSGVRPGSRVPYVPTAVLAVRRRALDAARGFDESLRFGEDVDLVWRLVAGGGRVRYEPAARASHPTRAGLGPWLRQRAGYGRSAAPLAARHGDAVSPLVVSPWSAAAWALAAGGAPGAGLAIVAGSALALARRAGPDRATAAELARLAVVGNFRAGGPMATAVRRAWLVPAVAVTAAVRRWGPPRSGRSSTLALGAALVGPALLDWARRRPAVGPARWVALSLADDLAYQYGVWAGVLQARSARALLPRW